MKCFEREMNTHLFGNPHSRSPSSMLSTDRIESTRVMALDFFKADPEHFDLIFVANATAAIKLVTDCMSDYSRSKESKGFWFGYHGDSHTSLVGMREVAGSNLRCFDLDGDVEEWLRRSERSMSQCGHDLPNQDGPVGLFAYPAQSNMNGRRLPLHWPGRLRATNSASREVYTLLDAAAFVATGQLDLSDEKNAPDFVALSFYKIFGFPDLGALIVRKKSGHILKARRYFGGGTVDMVINGSGDAMWHAKKASQLHEMVEDGTPAFHSIAALGIALETHQRLFGSMANVSKHTCILSNLLYRRMSSLAHANGQPVCQIYKGTSSEYGDSESQGPTVAFNVLTSRGEWIGKSDFESLAILNNIQIRTGGVCNPGGIATCLRVSPVKMRENFDEGVRCGNDLDEIDGKPTGVIRVSLGAMSSRKDIEYFVNFMHLFVDMEPNKEQSIASWSSQMSAEKPSLPTTAQSTKLQAMIRVEEGPSSYECPVAACIGLFGAKDELMDHLHVHRNDVKGRTASPSTKKRRSLWRILTCCGGSNYNQRHWLRKFVIA